MSYQNNSELQEPMGKWLWRVWSTYPFCLLGFNFLFLISCIPIITIPAAYCALHAVVQRYYRRMYGANLLKVYLKELKEAFWKRTGICWGIILSVFIAIKLSVLIPNTIIGVSVAAIVLLCAVSILSWFCAQTVFLNLTSMQALRNSLILTIIETTRNFGVILLWTFCLTAVSWGWPITGFLFVLLPVMQVTILTGIMMPSLRTHLVTDN